SVPDRRARLDRAHPALSIRRQCQLVGVARSGVYRTPSPANDNDLALMRRIDELFTAWPFLGSRRMAEGLQGAGRAVNRKRVQRLMRGAMNYSTQELRLLALTDHAARKFSAEDLPDLRSATTSKRTFCPSLRLCIPARSTALTCTKTSLPPSSGWMNPKPFWPLNHFTVPCVI